MENALVLASILLGVGMAALLTNFDRLIRASGIQWHWAQPLFALNTLLMSIYLWWIIAQGDQQTVSLADFLPVVLALLLLFLLSAVSLPDSFPSDGLDLAQYYQRHRRYMWGLVATLFLLFHLSILGDFGTAKADGTQPQPVHWSKAVVLAVVVTLMFVRNWWLVAIGFAILATVPIWIWSAALLG